MADNNHIDKKIDDTLNSMDHHTRATPRPYLQTRINARLAKGEPTIWDHLTSFITRPAIILAGLLSIIMINFIIISTTRESTVYGGTPQESFADGQGFSISTTTALYDIENIDQEHKRIYEQIIIKLDEITTKMGKPLLHYI